MSTYISFDNTGSRYQPKAVITDGVFDPEKYKEYSPLFMSATLTMAYGISFASFAAVWVHTFCMSYSFLTSGLVLTTSLQCGSVGISCVDFATRSKTNVMCTRV